MLNNTAVSYNPSSNYSDISPFSPSEVFPEYPYKDISKLQNPVYQQVRNVLQQLGLDKENFNKPSWNPFGSFIHPENKVLIKPNLVREKNPVNQDISGLITHPSVIRAVIDYCIIALKGKGEIIIGDAPIQSADFELIKSKLKLDELLDFYKGIEGIKISLKDFRKEIKRYNSSGEIFEHLIIPEKESIEINLKEKSFFWPVRRSFRKFRVTNYDPRKMVRFHNEEDNIYIIDRSVLEADVVIQIPKLKTHGKAGITCCMKNCVGINGQKDALVHHMKGGGYKGGDAYPGFNPLKWINENLYELKEKTEIKWLQRIAARWIGVNDGILKRLGGNTIFEGSWYGNITLWRMILDINNILFHASTKGEIQQEQTRKIFYIVDGIIGGDREGPLKPDNKFAGIIAGGWNPVLIDLSCAGLIGFDYKKITTIARALENSFLGFGNNKLTSASVLINDSRVKVTDIRPVVHFTPSKGWKNHIEAINLSDENPKKPFSL
jgi:uncharacterized protein (DUF362 family)